MTFNGLWFFVSLITASSLYLSPLWKADRKANGFLIITQKILSLPIFYQIALNGVISGVVSTIVIALLYAFIGNLTSITPLSWGIGWLVGALISGMIRQFMRQ